MDILYSSENLVRPSFSRPWSIQEAKLIFDKIDYNKLSKAERVLYKAISNELIDSKLDFDFSDKASFA